MSESLNPSHPSASLAVSPGERSPASTASRVSASDSTDPGGRGWQIVSIAAFSVTMFLSAALLFLVEPMFARMALPLLGGSASVWTTCLVFFQLTLLAGYAYTHLAANRLGMRARMALHGGVLVAALAVLPVKVPAGWLPPLQAHPVGWLLRLLLVAVGLPFFALAGTTPMLQDWFAHTGHRRSGDPYFLYAASNAGSLAGLLSYPILLEPLLRLAGQSRLWTCGYALFLLLVITCVVLVWRSPQEPSATRGVSRAMFDDRLLQGPPHPQTPLSQGGEGRVDLTALAPLGERVVIKEPGVDQPINVAPRLRLRWVVFAFVPSSLMLGVTTALTTDIPAIPLLWVLPLSIYLLSFVLVFARKPFSPVWVKRRVPFFILAAAVPVILKGVLPLLVILPLDLITLFAVAMVCHGEIARTRPATQHLTEFYFWVSVGGVLGGVFNALLAPMIFSTVLEYPIALVLAALLSSPGHRDEVSPRSHRLDYVLPAALGLAVAIAILALQAKGVAPGRWFNLIAFAPAAVCCLFFRSRPRRFGLGLAALLAASRLYAGPFGHTLHYERSFFGAYRVSDNLQNGYRVLFHGGTAHGVQSLDPARACEPLAYYTRTGPIGQVFESFADTPVENNVAVIGLGAGVMACYRRPHQQLTFYEIDPAVLRIAEDRRYFTFLTACAPGVRVVLGDARLRLREAPSHGFGMIVLDAFSGDSIPTHLLTREALALYLEKLAPGGVLAFHVSNRYLDLHSLLAALARDAGLYCLRNDDAVLSARESRSGKFASWWVVMSRQADDLDGLKEDSGWMVMRASPDARAWTDDFSNIISILRFNGR